MSCNLESVLLLREILRTVGMFSLFGLVMSCNMHDNDFTCLKINLITNQISHFLKWTCLLTHPFIFMGRNQIKGESDILLPTPSNKSLTWMCMLVIISSSYSHIYMLERREQMLSRCHNLKFIIWFGELCLFLFLKPAVWESDHAWRCRAFFRWRCANDLVRPMTTSVQTNGAPAATRASDPAVSCSPQEQKRGTEHENQSVCTELLARKIRSLPFGINKHETRPSYSV